MELMYLRGCVHTLIGYVEVAYHSARNFNFPPLSWTRLVRCAARCGLRFEPEIPAVGQLKTCALDRTDTGIDKALLSIQNLLVGVEEKIIQWFGHINKIRVPNTHALYFEGRKPRVRR